MYLFQFLEILASVVLFKDWTTYGFNPFGSIKIFSVTNSYFKLVYIQSKGASTQLERILQIMARINFMKLININYLTPLAAFYNFTALLDSSACLIFSTKYLASTTAKLQPILRLRQTPKATLYSMTISNTLSPKSFLITMVESFSPLALL